MAAYPPESRPDYDIEVATSGGTTTRPGSGIRSNGWTGATDKPKAGDHNWLFKWTGKWLRYIRQRLLSGRELHGQPSLGAEERRAVSWVASGFTVSTIATTRVALAPGVVYCEGTRCELTTQAIADLFLDDVDLGDSADSYLQIDPVQGIGVWDQVANGAAEPTPPDGYTSVVKVVTGVGSVSSIENLLLSSPVLSAQIYRMKSRRILPVNGSDALRDPEVYGWAQEHLYVVKTQGGSPVSFAIPDAVLANDGDAISIELMGSTMRDASSDGTMIHFREMWRRASSSNGVLVTDDQSSSGITSGAATLDITESSGQLSVEVTGIAATDITTMLWVRVTFAPGGGF